MVDIVVNHFGYAGSDSSIDYSVLSPFNSESAFHSYCTITAFDYLSNQTGVEDVRGRFHVLLSILVNF